MTASPQIVLQKSPNSLCEIEICNDRIGARAPLNRCCAFAPDLESMLRDKMLKILLQHNLGWSRSVHYSPEMTRLIAERNRGLRCATHRHDAADTVQVVERLAPRHQPLSHYRSGQA